MTPEKGAPSPLGLSLTEKGWNFAVYSPHAEKAVLGLFKSSKKEPIYQIPMDRTGDIWHIAIEQISGDFSYAYQCQKPGEKSVWVTDPYAKMITTSPTWETPFSYPLCSPLTTPADFSWENVQRPSIPKEDLIIYEMHLRGFTAHPSSKTSSHGTYAALIEKIPYLKKLGVNAVELMPIFEFDEGHNHTKDPKTGKDLPNYWGYNPISWFFPKRSFASDQTLQGALNEFKTLVKELHKNGIEIILDVVYNHTGETKEHPIAWSGIDHPIYYLVSESGKNLDYTGCGNTVNANHPAVQTLILDSLRYWVQEMQVDGFRFDLASIFTRGKDGHVLEHPPILTAMALDPILNQVKWIAEAWDAVGLYQLNFFPHQGPWSEWNGLYRDVVRRFIKGTNGKAGRFASALSGSDVVYSSTKTPTSSINFITAHDGFCLRDLVTYQSKHNEANGEHNQDGNNQNDNWNCGVEGPSIDPQISTLREKQMRNFWLALFLSQGVPMILMGDEYGHTRKGNNNPYVQDNDINWFLWNELEKNAPMFAFVKDLIFFRKAHPELRKTRFLTSQDICWHGAEPNNPRWEPESRFVAFSTKSSPKLYAAFNANFETAHVRLPTSNSWQLVVNTEQGWDQQWFCKKGPSLGPTVDLSPYSVLLAIEKI